MIDLKQIEGTLKYGKFDSTKPKYGIIAFVALTVMFAAVMSGLIYYFSLEQIKGENPLPKVNFIFLILGIVFVFLLLFLLCLIFLIKSLKLRKEILLWLQDAVELGASCEMLLSEIAHRALLLHTVFSLPPTAAKIRVRFKYNGKHYAKDSGYKSKSGEYKNQYQNIWVKYVNKSINILYSPKYDEVIVLKNNS